MSDCPNCGAEYNGRVDLDQNGRCGICDNEPCSTCGDRVLYTEQHAERHGKIICLDCMDKKVERILDRDGMPWTIEKTKRSNEIMEKYCND